ncbi:phage tail spike protein [Ligilactobacillus agilis]|uniref:phage tail spike protein n=1 Tax=Ligilactobacillus agilis TaxID=1601 RepID=UPI00242DA166|nr:phage tail spike protein [Ligilactobacillus agilis]
MIIYEANETDFFSNGLGTLPDATSALVTEERNGEFVLDVIYPQQGIRSELLTKNRIIKADAGHELKDQRFVIKKVTPTMDSDGYIYLTVHAEHVSYITADLGVTPNLTLSGNATQALEQWQTNLVGGHPDIMVDSDIISEHETNLDITKATNARQVLGGVEGSILDTWGGEYKFDNLHISLRGQRGTTANTLISYGRNLLTFEQEDDITDTYTSIYPYANVGLADGNNSKLVTVDGYFVDSQYVERYPNRKLLPVDFGSEFTDYKIGSKPSESDTGIYTTEAEIKKRLTELAKQYIENNRVGIPKVSTKITFADLSKTSEYAPLEQVNLCDIIPIRFEKLGIDTTIKVTRVVWNVLLDEYDSIELGDLRTTLGESISALESKTSGLANAVITAQSTADNQNSIFRTNGGTAEPVAKKTGDLWFKTDGDYQYMYQWDGAVWHEVVNTKTTDDIAKEVDKAKADAKVLSSEVELAKKQAQEAFAKAGFNADEISNVKTATSEVTETLTSTVRQTSELSESLKGVASETASRYSAVSSELSGTRSSLNVRASELAKEVASNSANITKANSQLYSQSEGLAKVSQSATKIEQTMTDLSGRVHTVETTASETKEALADAKGNITTLTKRADGTDTKIADAQGRVQTLESRADTWDLELSKKVNNTTYNAGIQNLGNQINLKANKSDLDGYATKAQLSVESDRITQQAGEIVTVRNLANGANDKIDGLRIGGRNLLKNSDTMDGWYRNQFWTKLSDTRKGCAIWQYTNGRWNGLSTWVYVEKGEIYTFSVDTRLVDRESVQAHMYIELNGDNENGYNKATIRYEDSSRAWHEDTPNLSKEWNRYKVTFVVTSNGYVRPRVETDDYATLQISRPKLEEGNVATPWQPSDLDLPDTIVSTVTTTTNAKQIVDSSGIYSEVNKLVDTKVGDVTTQLETYKHTVDDTGNKLRDVMGALKLDSNGNLTSNFNELIKTASGVEERYTQLNGKIDGIVVGGKNLLDGTSDFNSNYWYAANGTADIMQINGKTAVRGLKNWEGRRYKGTIQLEPNTDYTVSVYVRVNGGSGNGLNLGFYCNLDGKGDSFGLFNLGTLSTEWKRISLKWHNDNHREMTIPRVEWSGDFGTGWGSGFTAELQLEKGNKPSDWGMSDNDINQKLADANASIAKTKLVISKLANLFDVTVGDSSISVTNNGVLVKGKQVHIDGQTVIDNASIDGAKIKSLDAGKITTGTLNAASVKVINLDANNIKSGTISGNNLSLNLDDGTVSFKKGKIVSSNNKLILNIDDGSLAVGDASKRQGMMFNQGKMYMYDQGYFGDSTWNGNVYDWMLEMKKHPYAVLEYSSSFSGTSGSIFGGSGANFHSTSGVAIAYDKNVSQTASAGTTSGIFDNWNPLDGHGVFINENGIAMGAEDKLVSIVGGTSFDYGGQSIWNFKPTILVGTNLWTDNVYDHGYNINKLTSDGSNIYMQASALLTDTNTAIFNVENGDVEFAIKGNDRNFIIDASGHTSNGLIVKGSQNITNWLGCQDLTVRGAKNAVVQTTAGWTKINAYETAEYYFGDLGTAVTDDTSMVRIGIEPLFNETVNTNIPYQVFVTSYGEGYAWVAERGSNYFVIKSSVPNLEIGYEIKAKRKGYENVRLEIDEHMEVNKQ